MFVNFSKAFYSKHRGKREQILLAYDLPKETVTAMMMLHKSNGGVGARGVMVIVVGNGHGDTSSNPGRDWLHFT